MIPELHAFDSSWAYSWVTDRDSQIGPLNECTRCDVTEELNGGYTLELEYPATGKLAAELQPDRLIYCSAGNRMPAQRFRIKKVISPYIGKIKVYADHVSYDLSYLAVPPFNRGMVPPSASAAIQIIKDARAGILPSTEAFASFTINSTLPEVESYEGTYWYKSPVPRSLRSLLLGQEGSLIDRFGGEWMWDNYSCWLGRRRGMDNGLILEQGISLTDIQKEVTNDKFYTAIYPYYTYTDENQETQNVVYGLIFLDSNGETMSNATVWATGIYDGSQRFRQKTLMLDCSDYFGETVPTAAQLRQYADTYAQTHKTGITSTTYKIKMTTIPDVTDDVSLGDTVSIEYGSELIQTRIRKTVWDALRDTYKSVTVGDVQETLSDVIKKIR